MLTFNILGLIFFTGVVVLATLMIEHPEQWFDNYEKGAMTHAIKHFFKDNFFGI